METFKIPTSTVRINRSILGSLNKSIELNSSRTPDSIRKRRPLYGPGKTPVVEIVYNDENERQIRRRSSKESHQRKSVIRSRPSNVDNLYSYTENNKIGNKSNDFDNLSESALREHYQTCVSLFSENKLNSKNVWNIHIVEYVTAMINKTSDIMNILQLAGTTIDVGTKIYCLKVDEVHNDVIKLASTITAPKLNEPEPEENFDQEEDVDEEVIKKVQEKERKRKKKKDNHEDIEIHLTHDLESIKSAVVEYNAYCNKNTKTGKDHFYTLSICKNSKRNWEQMVNCRSDFKYWMPLNEYNEIDYPLKRVTIDVLDPIGHINPSFDDFIINEWNPDDDELPVRPQDQSECQRTSVMFNDEELPIPELDLTTNNNDFHDIPDAEQSFEEELAVPEKGLKPHVEYITDMRPGDGPLTETPLEYSYRTDPSKDDRYTISGLWAGPAHWKIKFLKQKKSEDENKENQEKKKTNKKPEIEEDILFECEDFATIDTTYMQPKKRKTKSVSNEAINYYQLLNDERSYCEYFRKTGFSFKHDLTMEPKFIYPRNWKIETIFLKKLNLRPKKYLCDVVLKKNPEVSPEFDMFDATLSGEYNYNNPDDSDYCCLPQFEDNENQLTHSPHSNSPEHTGYSNEFQFLNGIVDQSLTESNFVDLPNLPNNPVIQYAIHSKKMDMRKLKDCVWKTMVYLQTKDRKSLNKLIHKDIEIVNLKLSTIFQTVPYFLPLQVKKELTIALTFNAVLHLATEKGFFLKAVNLSDAIINPRESNSTNAE